MGSAAEGNMVDYLIVGAGPAGLQMGYEMKRDNVSHLILEAADVAGDFFKTYPRHRTLISINKKYNLLPEPDFNMRHDWNSLLSDDGGLLFTDYTDEIFPDADILVQYLQDYAKRYELNVKYNTKAVKVGKEKDGTIRVTDQNGEKYMCKALLLATGCIRSLLPDMPGVELCDTYAGHTLDKDVYRNKKVAIIGAKNSAFETADYLAGVAGIVHVYSHSEVKMAWDTHFVGDLRAINNSVIDMFHLKSLHALASNAQITAVREHKTPKGETGLQMDFTIQLPHWEPPSEGRFDATYDKIILATGWQYIDPDMFEADCVPASHGAQDKFPVLDESWESTVPNIYYMGTNMQSRDRQSASGFIHGFRYNVRSLYHILRNKYDGQSLKKDAFEKMNVEKLTDFVIKRISTTSALYQLNQGFLCDVAVFRDGEQGVEDSWKVDYYYELPQAWVLNNKFFKDQKHMCVITMGDQRKKFPKNLNVLEFSKPPDFQLSTNVCQPYNEAFLNWMSYGASVQFVNLGATLTVRYDIANLSGQKRERPYNKFKNLIAKYLGVGEPNLSEEYFDKEYLQARLTAWTPERIEQEKQMLLAKEEYQCDLRINRQSKANKA